MSAGDPTVTTLLVTLTGRDRPGVTSAVFDALAPFSVEVLDVEQVVLRGRLVLGVLVTAPRDEIRLRKTVEKVARNLGMEVEVESGAGDNLPRRLGRSHVTVLGHPLPARAVSAIAGRIADTGGNIDRIVRIARYPVIAIELDVSGTDPDMLRNALAIEAADQEVDVAVQPAGLYRRAKRLVVLDVDSTLIQGEVIEMLAAHAGYLDEVTRVTAAAMRGELDFAESLRRRVALLAGVDADALDDVRRKVQLTPGARTLVRTLKRLGYQLGVVSGGFSEVVEPIAAELGIDFVAANTLEVADGRLTGQVVGRIVDRPAKAEALREFASRAGVPLSQTVAIGDGANDLDMLAAAGLGVAFNAKPVVREAADTALSVPYLDAILYLLGITREEIEAADAEADAEV
ncbi:phosphoserine phosphatase SerB [Actinopolymorpha alba]|uniref:phosphoserine phosphatase SerB n=1 Tax=Actinopolymorpha alba TaxID=533267 RepID=UPI0003753209|nr:phosphoserine phosphatase SerB [Actinopolymorpha alba]